jgi:hypothetical protein
MLGYLQIGRLARPLSPCKGQRCADLFGQSSRIFFLTMSRPQAQAPPTVDKPKILFPEADGPINDTAAVGLASLNWMSIASSQD